MNTLLLFTVRMSSTVISYSGGWRMLAGAIVFTESTPAMSAKAAVHEVEAVTLLLFFFFFHPAADAMLAASAISNRLIASFFFPFIPVSSCPAVWSFCAGLRCMQYR